MNNQFKPGDLALIVGALNFPEFIGRVVELTQQTVNSNGDKSWLWVGCEVRSGSLERHLMPLRGDFQPERQQSREVKA